MDPSSQTIFTPTPVRRRSARNLGFVGNTDSDTDSLAKDLQLTPGSTIKVAVAVAVPRKRVTEASFDDSRSPSVESWNISSRRGASLDYDTAETSAIVTPAERSVIGTKRGTFSDKIYSLTGSASKSGYCGLISSVAGKGKRKRGHESTSDEDFMGGDAHLAQTLQEEEYAKIEEPAKPVAPKRSLNRASKSHARKVIKIENSEDEILFDIDSDDFDLGNTSLENERQKFKKIKTSTALPMRAARDNARKSIAAKVSLGIMDSDDGVEDSELSAYESDLDTEAADLDSADSVSIASADISAAVAITVAPQTLPSSRRSGFRRSRPSRFEDGLVGTRVTELPSADRNR